MTEEPQKLEGEDKADLVGIMYSEKKWLVPAWYKAVFFWCAVGLVVPLASYTIWKRFTFQTLMVDSVVDPENMKERAAPAILLPLGESGQQWDLASKRGRWVLVNYWATWCAPCRDEMPSMEMLNRRVQRDALPLDIVAVSVDDTWTEVNRFFGATQPTFAVPWDKDKRIATMWGTRKFPETYLVNPEGKVVAKFTGPRDWYNQGTVKYFQDVIAGRRKAAS